MGKDYDLYPSLVEERAAERYTKGFLGEIVNKNQYLKIRLRRNIDEIDIFDYKIPPLPPELQKALRQSIFGDNTLLDGCRRRSIQSIVDRGGNYTVTSEGARRTLEALGMTNQDIMAINIICGREMRKVGFDRFSFWEVSSNIEELLNLLGLQNLTGEKLSIISLGSGKTPEAKSCLSVFGGEMDNFTGYDKNPDHIQQAAVLNPYDARLSFKVKDLKDGLPEAEPDLVIVRNPNIFIYDVKGQLDPNPEWEFIFRQLKEKYPDAGILITTLTKEEMKKAEDYLGEDGSYKENPFSTHFRIRLGSYGEFDLPAAMDQYYLFLQAKREKLE